MPSARDAQRVEKAVAAELAWLSGHREEPGWPTLPPWLTRPKRYLQLPGFTAAERPRKLRAEPPDAYASEQRLGEIVSHLTPLTVGTLPGWLVPLTEHLMAWTLAANASDDEEREPEGTAIYLERNVLRLPWDSVCGSAE